MQRPWAAPILRWAGSKRQLLPALLERCPTPIARYIEPFAGSACLFFALKPPRAVLGDINHELMLTYRILRTHPRLLARAARCFPDTARTYYSLRSKMPEQLPDLARAARFVYLNRHAFNGVFRLNQKGRFNVPRGRRTGRLPDEASFLRCAIALRGARLITGDFEECLRGVKRGDFVYLDPPYAVAGKRRRGEYGYGAFDTPDLRRLDVALNAIDAAGGTFLLSYADTAAARRVTRSWVRAKIQVRRHVAGFAGKRRTVPELLVTNIR
jgi:DNA adenine methylase